MASLETVMEKTIQFRISAGNENRGISLRQLNFPNVYKCETMYLNAE